MVLQPELTAITSEAEFSQNFSCVTSSQSASGSVLISNGLQSKAFQTQVERATTESKTAKEKAVCLPPQLLILNSFRLELEPCPGGYTPEAIDTRESLWGCECDTTLKNLVLCSSDQDTVFIRVGAVYTLLPYTWLVAVCCGYRHFIGCLILTLLFGQIP